jgi:hypothetical protein
LGTGGRLGFAPLGAFGLDGMPSAFGSRPIRKNQAMTSAKA